MLLIVNFRYIMSARTEYLLQGMSEESIFLIQKMLGHVFTKFTQEPRVSMTPSSALSFRFYDKYLQYVRLIEMFGVDFLRRSSDERLKSSATGPPTPNRSPAAALKLLLEAHDMLTSLVNLQSCRNLHILREPAASSEPAMKRAAANGDGDRGVESDELLDILHMLGIAEFWPKQRQVIEHLRCGKNLMVSLSVGRGKSLCYQFPAIMQMMTLYTDVEGNQKVELTPSSVKRQIVVVIETLNSIIVDQVTNIRSRLCSVAKNYNLTDFDPLSFVSVFVSSYSLRQCFSTADQQHISNENLKILAGRSAVTLLYTTPESFYAGFETFWMPLIDDNRIGALIFDECHNMISWGMSFKHIYPDVLVLANVVATKYKIPICALSGTLNAFSIVQLCESLFKGMDVALISEDFLRSNISFDVVDCDKLLFDRPLNRKFKASTIMSTTVGDILSKQDNSAHGLVFCLTKRDCETLQTQLLTTHKIRGTVCHSSSATMTNIIEHWESRDGQVNGRKTAVDTNVIIATTILSHGIDKQDISFLILAGSFNSLDSIIQMTGRLARRGQQATCHVLYTMADICRNLSLVQHGVALFSEDEFRNVLVRDGYVFPAIDLSELHKCSPRAASFARNNVLGMLDMEHAGEADDSAAVPVKEAMLRSWIKYTDIRDVAAIFYRSSSFCNNPLSLSSLIQKYSLEEQNSKNDTLPVESLQPAVRTILELGSFVLLFLTTKLNFIRPFGYVVENLTWFLFDVLSSPGDFSCDASEAKIPKLGAAAANRFIVCLLSTSDAKEDGKIADNKALQSIIRLRFAIDLAYAYDISHVNGQVQCKHPASRENIKDGTISRNSLVNEITSLVSYIVQYMAALLTLMCPSLQQAVHDLRGKPPIILQRLRQPDQLMILMMASNVAHLSLLWFPHAKRSYSEGGRLSATVSGETMAPSYAACACVHRHQQKGRCQKEDNNSILGVIERELLCKCTGPEGVPLLTRDKGLYGSVGEDAPCTAEPGQALEGI